MSTICRNSYGERLRVSGPITLTDYLRRFGWYHRIYDRWRLPAYGMPDSIRQAATRKLGAPIVGASGTEFWSIEPARARSLRLPNMGVSVSEDL